MKIGDYHCDSKKAFELIPEHPEQVRRAGIFKIGEQHYRFATFYPPTERWPNFRTLNGESEENNNGQYRFGSFEEAEKALQTWAEQNNCRLEKISQCED